MLDLATELIEITHGRDYNVKPITIGQTTGNRQYHRNQITISGNKIGRGEGPVVEIDIVAIPTGAFNIEIWAQDMDLTQPGMIYPTKRFDPTAADFCGTTILKDFYFRQLKWLDKELEELDEIEEPKVIGKRLHNVPFQYDVHVT